MDELERLAEDLEYALTWRQEELRAFLNAGGTVGRDEWEEAFRKMTIVAWYAHLEGFAKDAFQAYIDYLNRKDLKCREVDARLAASALSEEFEKMDNENYKSDLFQRNFPDDSELHGQFRRAELLENIRNLFEQPVEIEKEKVVRTNSNLGPDVLRKLLFRTGLPHDSFDEYRGDLFKLLNKRNDIAHGSRPGPMSEEEAEDLRSLCEAIMEDLRRLIYRAARKKRYNDAWAKKGGSGAA